MELIAIMLNANLPLVGILVPWHDLWEDWDGSLSAVPSKHVKAARQVGLVAYYFSLGDVRLNPPLIAGRTLDAADNWVTDWFAWPQVLYLQRGYPRSRRERLVWRRVSSNAVRINSRTTLPKWLCHRELISFPDIAPYLPETHLLRSPRTAIEMLKRHSSIYLKPDMGSGGQGISRIMVHRPDLYVLNTMISGAKTLLLNRRSLLWYLHLLALRHDIVVQAEVPLFRMLDGRKVDVRALMQKDGRGNWVVEYVGMRVGNLGSIVTNSAQGGEWLWMDQWEERAAWSKEASMSLEQQLIDISLRVARRLDQSLGRMGELGLDLAFDGRGGFWLLEANSRPDKSDRIATEKLAPKFTRVMEYAKFLL